MVHFGSRLVKVGSGKQKSSWVRSKERTLELVVFLLPYYSSGIVGYRSTVYNMVGSTYPRPKHPSTSSCRTPSYNPESMIRTRPATRYPEESGL